MIVICIILIVFAGLAKAVMDFSADSGEKNSTWENKYEQPVQVYFNHWYYFGLYKPKYKEKFPYSSTLLVWITDRWHFAQRLFLTSIYYVISICFCKAWALNWVYLHGIALIVLPIILGVSFEILYKGLKNTNR